MEELSTSHGKISLPFFMPDATRAAVRGLSFQEISETGTKAMVVNTYHLMLRPGIETIRALGGVHKFMNYSGILLSDSGGYQVYSLIHKNPKLGEITEEGAKFRDVLDGRWRMLTPEMSVRIQADLGVDMMVVLDDPRPNDVPRAEMEEALERTVRWARRCRDEYVRQYEKRGWDERTAPKLFAVVQGGPYADLRRQCAESLASIGDFAGYGFGGRHLDREGKIDTEILRATVEAIPGNKLKFALGVGTPADIIACVKMGWQMFDCVIPTREARHGRIFVWSEPQNEQSLAYHTLNLTNEKFRLDPKSPAEGCDCGCNRYSLAYLRHLFVVGDPLAGTIVSRHNLRFYARLMEKLRFVEKKGEAEFEA